MSKLSTRADIQPTQIARAQLLAPKLISKQVAVVLEFSRFRDRS
jgi:hypothetical protein